jgi:general secretion pathway protein M
VTSAWFQRWERLSDRERTVVTLGGIVLLLGLGFAFIVDPELERLDLLNRQAARKERAMGELAAIVKDYAEINARLQQFEARVKPAAGTFSLLPFLEDAAAQGQIRDRIASMQPITASPAEAGYREAAVEMRLDGLTMPQLVAFLAQLDRAPAGLQIKRFQMKPRFDAPYLLEVRLRVSSYEKE